MQGGIPRSGRVRVGSALQKERGEGAVAAVGCNDQGAGPGRGRLVYVGAGVEQQLRPECTSPPRAARGAA